VPRERVARRDNVRAVHNRRATAAVIRELTHRRLVSSVSKARNSEAAEQSLGCVERVAIACLRDPIP